MPQYRDTLHVIARDIQRNDAVGNFCMQIADHFAKLGNPVSVAAENFGSRATDGIFPISAALDKIKSNDTILFHYSTEDPWFERIAALSNPKILYFHNITPPEYFRGVDPRTEGLVAAGLAQRWHAGRFDVLMANSTVSARVLWEGLSGPDQDRIAASAVLCCPPIIDMDRWRSAEDELVERPPAVRYLLSVGRLVPHKSVIDVIEGFALAAADDPDLGLAIVGGPAEGPYFAQLAGRAAALDDDVGRRIRFYSGISDGALRHLFSAAAGFVSMSRHEGFCVPLADALAFDLPVIIRREPGMMETAGPAALAVESAADLAAAIAALRDGPTREALARARTRQVAALREAASGRLLEQAVALARGRISAGLRRG
ncbi:MAG: glycosyltransferase [Rhodoplanes sp.]|uniref:glycosyltransferase n=1 Tax=Rhodoplanes sp. TaxID=1968906 RepID=UPI001820E746|nr:glycosyltransferase [Rhodoplanes sp.]NVO17986.1 glycosyltransferase [Rhodoplanes sp.]